MLHLILQALLFSLGSSIKSLPSLLSGECSIPEDGSPIQCGDIIISQDDMLRDAVAIPPENFTFGSSDSGIKQAQEDGYLSNAKYESTRWWEAGQEWRPEEQQGGCIRPRRQFCRVTIPTVTVITTEYTSTTILMPSTIWHTSYAIILSTMSQTGPSSKLNITIRSTTTSTVTQTTTIRTTTVTSQLSSTTVTTQVTSRAIIPTYIDTGCPNCTF